MALIENFPISETASDSTIEFNKTEIERNGEIEIITSNKTFVEINPMSENLKEAVRKNAPDMTDLLQSIISQKKEKVGDLKIEGDTIHADDISPMTLHLFALEAAKFGKTITYKEVKSIVISD